MPHDTQIDFVCYEEGGIIDLQRAFDDLLPQTLLRIPAEVETPTEFKPFQPSFQPLRLHHAADDLFDQRGHRFSFLKRTVAEDEAIQSEAVDAGSLPVPIPARTPFYSFHDELLIRARERSVERRRESLLKAKYWRDLLIWTLIEMVVFGGLGSLFAGFLAKYRDLSMDRTSGVILMSGAAMAGLVLIVKLSRSGPKPLTNPARA